MKKLKYMIKYLGPTDYYGNPIISPKYINWMEENCKGKWFYYSPDAPNPNFGEFSQAPDDWPMFFDMQFHFSRKSDIDAFCKNFG